MKRIFILLMFGTFSSFVYSQNDDFSMHTRRLQAMKNTKDNFFELTRISDPVSPSRSGGSYVELFIEWYESGEIFLVLEFNNVSRVMLDIYTYLVLDKNLNKKIFACGEKDCFTNEFFSGESVFFRQTGRFYLEEDEYLYLKELVNSGGGEYRVLWNYNHGDRAFSKAEINSFQKVLDAYESLRYIVEANSKHK